MQRARAMCEQWASRAAAVDVERTLVDLDTSLLFVDQATKHICATASYSAGSTRLHAYYTGAFLPALLALGLSLRSSPAPSWPPPLHLGLAQAA